MAVDIFDTIAEPEKRTDVFDTISEPERDIFDMVAEEGRFRGAGYTGTWQEETPQLTAGKKPGIVGRIREAIHERATKPHPKGVADSTREFDLPTVADPSAPPEGFVPSLTEKDKRIGIGEQAKRILTDPYEFGKRLPFSPVGALEQVEMLSAMERLKKNDYRKETLPPIMYGMAVPAKGISRTPELQRKADQQFVENYILKRSEEAERGMTFGAKVLTGVSILPAWMVEFAMTGGLATLGNKSAQQAGKKLLGRYAATKIGQVGLKTAGWLGGAGVRTTAGMPHRVAEATLRRVVSQNLEKKPENWATAIAKGWGEVFIETASEEAGATITKGLVGSLKKLPFGSKLLSQLERAWKKIHPKGTSAEFINQLFKKGGYSNFIGEVGEERLATIMHAIAKTEDFGTGEKADLLDRLYAGLSQDVRNFPVEAAVLATPALARFALEKAVSIPTAAKPAGVVPVTPPQPVAEGKVGALLKEEFIKAKKTLTTLKSEGVKFADDALIQLELMTPQEKAAFGAQLDQIEKTIQDATKKKTKLRAVLQEFVESEGESIKPLLEREFIFTGETKPSPVLEVIQQARPPKPVAEGKVELDAKKHYVPGNIVFSGYWKKFDRVVDFKELDRGQWEVTVEEVEKQDGKWITVGDKRTHRTSPGKSDKVIEQPPPAKLKKQPETKITPEVSKGELAKAEFVKRHAVDILPRKQQILAEIDSALKAAPSETELKKKLSKEIPEPDSNLPTKEYWKESQDRQKLINAEIEKIKAKRIDFEIDGGAQVINTKEALQAFRKQVTALPEKEYWPKITGPKKPPARKPIAAKKEAAKQLVYTEDKTIFTDGKIMVRGKPPTGAKFAAESKYTKEKPLSKTFTDELLNTPTEPAEFSHYAIKDPATGEGASLKPVPGISEEKFAVVIFKTGGKFVHYNQNLFNIIRNRFPKAEYGISSSGLLVAKKGGKPVAVLMSIEGPEGVFSSKPIVEFEYKPPSARVSKIGFPAHPAGKEMPTAMERIAKEPISAREIITHLSKSLKVPYASMATHRPRMAAGWYEVKPVGIRQINVRDLGTAAHEAGHHIDYFYKIRQAGISKAGRRTWKMPEGTAKGTAAELVKLGKMLYGATKPKGGYKSEGVAEFLRGYLTGHIDVRKEAPHFYNWFIKDYLPNNPEIADALRNAKDMLTDYRLQGAEARIESQINRKEINQILANRVKMANLWMQEMFVDEFAPLRVGIEEAGIKRAKLKPSDDPYELAVFFSQKEGARARQMVLFGTIDLWGNKTGKGLKEIMKPIADQNAVRAFTHWIVSARSLDLWKRGINPGISKADAWHVYNLYKDNEGWKEVAKEITDWNHRVLDYLVQAGGLQKEIANKMAELNPIYVPFMRAFAKGEKRFGGGGAGRGLITTKKGVFAIKGSGREIIDPFESMITQTQRMISIAHKSVIARALANLESKYRGLAGFIWKVPGPKRATTFQAEQVKKQLMKMGVEFPEAGLKEMDALLTVYGNSPIYFGKENIICIVENDKRQWYEVSPEMYRLLQGLDKFYLPRFLNLTLGKAARSVRLGATGINASFGLIKNPIRDALDTIFKGTHARGPGATVQGVAKDLSRLGFAKSLGIKPSKAAQEFVGMGGQISGFIGQDRKSLQHLKGEMLASNIGRYSIHTVKHPIDALREVFGVAESGPRIQEYKKALEFAEKKYGKGSPNAKVYAFNKAQDQTINYSRHGVIGKWLNQMIPFWNANMQDLSKVHRTFRTRGKQATAYAVAFLTLPAFGLWWLNKDEQWYKDLPAYEKANYLHIDVPGEYTILRLPVPFLVGHIFQGFPVAVCDALYTADKTKMTQFFGQVLKGDIYSLTEWPAIISPVIDVLQNKDWAGRPIVPRSVEGKLPSDQYKEYTTEFCKTMGKILNCSPAKIEHLLNSWSGGLYRRTGATTEQLLRLKKEERQPADWPLVGTLFVRDPYAPKAQIQRFYDRRDLLEQKYRSRKITRPELVERQLYGQISRALSPLWKKLKNAKTIKQREKIYKVIRVFVEAGQKSSKRLDRYEIPANIKTR